MQAIEHVVTVCPIVPVRLVDSSCTNICLCLIVSNKHTYKYIKVNFKKSKKKSFYTWPSRQVGYRPNHCVLSEFRLILHNKTTQDLTTDS